MDYKTKKELIASLTEYDIASGVLIFTSGDVLHLDWSNVNDVENEEIVESECTCGQEECTCDSESGSGCKCKSNIPDDNSEWTPPARYWIVANGHDYFVDDCKVNAMGIGIDVIWKQMIKGKETTVMGTIYDTNAIIFDYQTEMTLEAFASVKRQQFDHIVARAKEAREMGEAEQVESKAKSDKDVPVNRTATETVMKSYN